MLELKTTASVKAFVEASIEAIKEGKKNPWIAYIEDGLILGAYPSRASAQAAAKEKGGKVKKAEEVELVAVKADEIHAKSEEPEESPKAEEEPPKKKEREQSTVGSPCSLVWEIADEMKGARRKDVVAACMKAGVAEYTAKTQYQRWYTANKASGTLGK